MVLQLQL